MQSVTHKLGPLNFPFQAPPATTPRSISGREERVWKDRTGTPSPIGTNRPDRPPSDLSSQNRRRSSPAAPNNLAAFDGSWLRRYTDSLQMLPTL